MKKIMILGFFILSVCVVNAQSKAAAFLSSYSTLDELKNGGDDDEVAAAEWFVNTYGGTFLSTGSVTNVEALSGYDAVWVMIDRVGLELGSGNLPAEYKELFSILRDYSKNGGKLLLTNHATSIVAGIGRTTRQPGIFVSGAGAENGDIWGLNVIIGSGSEPYYADHRTHEFFDGITFEEGIPNTHCEIIPLIASGYKEDHNCMWDLNTFGYTVPEGSNTVAMYEQEADCEVLGTWQHVGDFCCAGMVDFHAQKNGYGRIVCVGVAAYEWHQNVESSNPYQVNIEKMTENILNELTKENGAATFVPHVGEKSLSVVIEGDIARVVTTGDYTDFNILTIDGRLIGRYNITEMSNGIELVNNGCYILQASSGKGESRTIKFIK